MQLWFVTSRRSPISACAEPQEALLLLKRKGQHHLPELLDGLMLSAVAAIIACSCFELCKVEVWQAANKQFQLLVSEQA